MALESKSGPPSAPGKFSIYAVAVGAVGAAYALFLVIPALSMTPLGLFITAVAAAAAYGGYRPALLAAVLSTVAACGWVMPSLLTLPGVLWTLGVFVAVALLVARLSAARHAAEKALRHWETVVEASGDAIYSKDLEGTITAWNRAAADLYGYSAAEMIGSSVARLIPEERQQELSDFLARLRRGEGVSSVETDRLTRDGRRISVSLTLSPMCDPEGSPVGVSVICHDISARKRVEAALQESEERFRSIVTDAPIPIVVHTVEGNALAVSRAFTRLTGYTLEDIPDARAWLQKVCRVPEEDLEVAQRLFCAKCEMVACFAKEERVIETRSGEKRTWIIHASRPQSLSNGCRVMASMAMDITERKQIEEALRESEHRYRVLFTNMTEGFALGEVLLGDDGVPCDFRFIEVNDAFERQSGLTRDILGRPMREVLPNLEPFWIETYCGVALGGEPVHFENFNRDTRRHYDVFCYRPEPGRFAILFHDITERKRAEEALQRSEDRFREAFAHAPVGIVITDLEGRFLQANRAYCRLVGHEEHELLQPDFDFKRFTHPDDLRHNLDEWARLLAGEIPAFFVEKRYIRKDGETVWARASATLRRDDAGCPWQVVGLVEDITERRLAEEALRESEERYRTLFNEIDEGFCVIEMLFDENERPVDYRFLETNPSFEMQTGLNHAQGRRVRELLPKHEDHWFEIYGEIALTGRPARFQNAAGQLGRWYDVYAFRFGRPELRQVAVLFSDITERRSAEEVLRRSEQVLAQAGQMAHFGAWEVEFSDFEDFDNNPLHWSDEVFRIFGYEPGGIEPTNALFKGRIHPEDRPKVLEAIRTALSERRTYRVEHRILRPDGEERTVAEYAEIVFDEAGRPRRMLGAVQDITERTRTEDALRAFTQTLEDRVQERTAQLEHSYEALRQSERLATLGEAMAALSHESRNAVQNCMAALQMLRRLVKEDAKQIHYVEMALKSLENLRGAYEDIRDYAAPMRLERANASLAEVWRETWAELGSRMAERTVRLVEAQECLDLVCDVDTPRLKQVFRNLIENSLDACPDPVEITIACEDVDFEGQPALRVSVRDNGPGVDSATRDRLLDPFFTTKAKGTGLGLAIVRRIVEAHGGRIGIAAENGQGFEVVIDLPRQCQ